MSATKDYLAILKIEKERNELLKEMQDRLAELNLGVFLPKRGKLDPRACVAWDGFYGPWINVSVDRGPAVVEVVV